MDTSTDNTGANPVIHIDLDALDARLDGGKRWITGWGDYTSPEGATCLHGAVRSCQPVPGDAQIIEQVGDRFGFGTEDNDEASSWDEVQAKVPSDITDQMLSETFGRQWAQVVALVRRAAVRTAEEAELLAGAWAATRGAARDAAWRAARDTAWRAARDTAWRATWRAAQDAAQNAAWAAAWAAAQDAAWGAAWGAVQDAAWTATRNVARDTAQDAARDAASALVVRDLIGQHGFTQAHYDALVGPWALVIGPVHPDDSDAVAAASG